MKSDKNDICELLNALREDSLTPEQFTQLDQLLATDESARREYIRFMNLCVDLKDFEQAGILQNDINHAELESMGPEFSLSPADSQLWKALSLDQKHSPSVSVQDMPQPPELVTVGKTDKPDLFKLSNAKRSFLIFFASLAALVLMIVYVQVGPSSRLATVATLTRTVDTQWQSVTGRLQENAQLCAGPLHLTKGCAEIITNTGAQIILQAPVQLELESDSQLLLKRGRLTVKIASDPSSNFVVRTPNACVVDFGTEFGVDYDDYNQTSTHVFQGEVELRAGPNPLKFQNAVKLIKDQAAQANPQGSLHEAKKIASQFVRSDEFENRYRAAHGSVYDRWKAYSYQLRRDPDMVAYYTFERLGDRPDTLFNMAVSTEGKLNGTLTGFDESSQPTWDQGRWPEKTALSFDRQYHQYVYVPTDPDLGVNGPLTIAAWIYIADPKDGGHIVSNRLEGSTINYQLGYRSPDSSFWDQRIQLARKESYHTVSDFIHSDKFPVQYGWVHVAATHDNQTLKYYLNGRLLCTKSWIYKQDLVEAGLLIGATYHDRIDESRFGGKMGEVAILKRVFSNEEIYRMYQAGKPE